MSRKLEGKVALVTGASKGIGASIAKHLAGEGADVIVNYNSDKAGAEHVVKDIASKGRKAVAVQGNFASEKDIRRVFAESKQAFGQLDILVNNAGVYEFTPIEEVTFEHYQRMFNLNVFGLIIASQEAARAFGDRGGSIVNISSVVSSVAPATSSVYTATKAAVDGVTRALANELGPRGIRVNSVNPGMVATEGATDFVNSDFRTAVEAMTPLGRIGAPEDVAPAVVFFASDDSSWITGQSLVTAGGYR